ncbi:MAG: hypothetical protein ACK56X_04440 [Planctomyces sp.]|jgi:hypothetical protein
MTPIQFAVSSICLVISMAGCGKSANDELNADATPPPVIEPYSLTPAPQEHSPVKLKTVAYRGGIAKFSIPDSWLEENEPSGGATYYEDREDSGTLRLNVLQFESKEPSEMMIQDLIRNQNYEPLQDELAIRRETESTSENGETLDIYSWNVAVPVPPNTVRLAVFSYTILQSQLSESPFQREIEVLDNSFRHAEYSKDAGMAGDYTPE